MTTFIVVLFVASCTLCFFGGFCLSTMLAEITFLKKIRASGEKERREG